MKDSKSIRINKIEPLATPNHLINTHPIDAHSEALVKTTRQTIDNILQNKEDRLVVIVGPCSIHDTKAALEYAKRLQPLAEQYSDTLCVIMRVYFEKPRTTIGWKGLINDPTLDGEFLINQGLDTARGLLLQINQMGLPTGTEFLDTIIPQYIADLISWAAIGARTTESQIHREMASGLSMPVGFKNGTEGNIDIAVDAIYAANHPHHFLGVTKNGEAAIVATTGNQSAHIILRGGKQTGPNYDATAVAKTVSSLAAKKRLTKVMIDCSHGNSKKDHTRQLVILEDICNRIISGDQHIFGVMLESHLVEGNQSLTTSDQLTYGKSITDACMGWESTEKALVLLDQAVKQQRERNHG